MLGRYVQKMLTIDKLELLHEVYYSSSGSNSPRELTLGISIVRYSNKGGPTPTFLVSGDLQGRESNESNRLLGELVADEIEALQELELLPPFDFCSLCGDFYDYPDLSKLGGTGDVTSALNALSRCATNTFAVLGNHDEVDLGQLSSRVQILDGEVVKTKSFVIGGVSGIIGNPKRNNRKTEPEFLEALQKVSGSKTDIVMLHQGPEGATDACHGLKLINEVLLNRSDLLVLFGHCHWEEPFHHEGNNLFCNVDARMLAFLPIAQT